jgi:drug/metabolite transporter (DMT)-like permease
MEPARLFGVTLSVAGVMVLAAGNVARPTADSKVVFEGDLLLVGAVLSWGGYLTLLKPLIRRYGSLNTLAGTFLMGFLLQLPIALAATRDWHRVSSAPASAWWALAYLAIVATGIGLACQNLALHRLDASYVATVGNMSPMLTILWGVIFLREAATPWLLAGAILTVAGVALTTRARLRQVKDSRAEPGRIASSRGARRGCRRIERGAALGAAFDRLARAGVQNQVSIRIGRNDGLLSHPKSVGLGNNR